MSRTISVRLSGELIQRIDSQCNTNSCNRNDFVKNAINNALSMERSVPKVKIKKISYDDGKTWIDLE